MVFYYHDRHTAEADAKLFSGMYSNEDKVLFIIHCDTGGWKLTTTPEKGVEGVALNGEVFSNHM